VPLPVTSKRAVWKEVLLLWLGTLLVIRLLVAFFSGVLWDAPLALVAILFMYVPVWWCRRQGVDPDDYPLAIPAFSDRKAWGQAFKWSGILVLATFSIWIPLYHVYQTAIVPWGLETGCAMGFEPACMTNFRPPAFEGTLPSNLLMLIGYHLFFVAIPEEIFYRGYMQSRLNQIYPPKWRWFGVPVGWGLVWTCLLFAVGHSLVVFQWWHFAIFFPSLAFGWLREKTGQIMAPALFHAACNITVATLDTLYGILPP